MLPRSPESRRPGTNFLRAETPEPPRGRAELGPHPRPGRGDARQVPGSPHSAAARASASPRSSCQGPRPPPSRPVRSGDPVSSPGGLRASGANADGPAGRLDPLGPLPPFHFRGPPGRVVAARRSSAAPLFAPKGPCRSRRTDPSFMLQCCNVSATEGGKRPRSQTKRKNWCVTHLLGYLQSPNCLPGVFLAEAVRCLSLFFPRKKMD